MKVSVLVAVKNEESHIVDALDSVLKNPVSFLDLELVVVDDGSTDSTVQLVKSYGDARLILKETGGVGKAAAYSLAYSLASGDYFVLFAGDDLLEVEALHARLACLRAAEGPAVSFAKMLSFSDDPKYDNIILPRNPKLGMRSGSGIGFNKDFGDKVFPIPSELVNEDSWMMLFVEYMECEIHEVPQVGIRYRIHANNSYKRGAEFSLVNQQQWVRSFAAPLFVARYHESLSMINQSRIASLVVANNLRFLGKGILLLFVPNIAFISKVKLFFNSRAFLYSVRERFYNFFSGR